MRLARIRDVSLVTKFAAASILPLAGLALLLGHFFGDHVRSRTFRQSERSAVVVANAVRSQLSSASLDRTLSAAEIRRLDRLFESVRPAGVGGVRISDVHGRTIYSIDHRQIGKRLAFTPGAVAAFAGSDWTRLIGDDKRVETYTPVRDSRDEVIDGVLRLEFDVAEVSRGIDRDVSIMYLLIAGGFAMLFAILVPIVGRASRRLRRQASENEYLALHDHLTGLPNRLLFADRVQHGIRAAKREGAEGAVVLIDVDRFKEVNDTLGHRSGDELLRSLGARVQQLMRESDTVARFGGDEFALFLPGVSREAELIQIIERIQSAFAEPFTLDGLPLEVEASIGIALYPIHGEDEETLIRRADVAMYVAKRMKSRYAFYDLDLDDYNPQRLGLVAQLRRAIAERELVVHFQPKGQMRGGGVDSVEALVRWQHPVRGLLAPHEFVPIAQNTGLINPLTAYVLTEALDECKAWRARGFDVAVSVNIATRNLLDLDFPQFVESLLRERDLSPKALELEITESSVLTDPRRATRVLHALHELGVRLSVDDFGTGYSSFTYLSQLPVDTIKIDRSFVMAMSDDEQSDAIVRSTIDMGRNLNLEVIAEGVETHEAWTRLADLGADAVQGFYLSRPLPAKELLTWLERKQQPRGEATVVQLRSLPSA